MVDEQGSAENTMLLYHFTNLENFIRISKTGAISLCDITKSNDPLEGVFVLNALEQACQRLLWEEEDQANCIEIYKKLQEFKDDEFSFGRLQHMVFSLSFCEPENRLELWRTYGDNGCGVALGFDKSTIEKIGHDEGFRFEKITYKSDEELQQDCIILLKNHLHDDVNSFMDSLQSFFMNGYFIKRIENRNEKEWRLVYTGLDLSPYLLCSPSVPAEIDVYPKRDDVVAVYNLDISEKLEINNILLGPRCKATTNEIKLIMAKYGIHIFGCESDYIKMR